MKIGFNQSIVSSIVFSCVLLISSSSVYSSARSLFDDTLDRLTENPHHIFSTEDAAHLSRDPRFQAFLDHYNRYVQIKEPLVNGSQGIFYDKDSSSSLIFNAFLRWTVLKGGDLDVKALTGRELESSLVHVNYLLYSFGPEVLERNAVSPDLDTKKVTRLSILRHELQQELDARSSIFALAVTPGADASPKPALWLLGDQYEKISHVSWDPSGQYLMCLGHKGTAQKILVYSFDSATLNLKLCAEMPVILEGFPVLEATHLLWGPDHGVIVCGGNSPDKRKSISYSYGFSSVKNSISPLKVIQTISGYEVAALQAFWSSGMTCLCLVRAGECVVFRWDKPSVSFVLDKIVHPGLNRVISASLSYDMNYFLTSHAQAPFIRITKSDMPFGAFASSQFTDKLRDPQWQPKSFFFVARSQVEADVIILYEYNPRLDRVFVSQRIHAGAAVTSMKWSADGAYLFVCGDASMVYGSGARAYAFDGKLLQLMGSFDDSALGINKVSECAYLPSANVMVLAGKAQDFASGVAFPFVQRSSTKKNAQVSQGKGLFQVKKPALPVISVAVAKSIDPQAVHQYLDQVPTEKNIVFGSVLMLVNAHDSSRCLAACDAPEVRCAHGGKAFPCARSIRPGDVSGEYLSSWWIVEGESWLERLDSPVKPFAQMHLKNLATGEKLCFTQDHTPIYGMLEDKSFVGLSAEGSSLSIGRIDDSCDAWRVGECVQLKNKAGCAALSDVPLRHPILQKMGIGNLSVVPCGQEPASAAFWVANRNMSLSTLFSQALKGSECCEFLLKRVDALWGKDLKQVVRRSLQAGLAKGI